MENAVDTIEGMFNKAEKDLDYMSRKLDRQLENVKDGDSKTNPVKLMKKLELIKTEYANVIQDVRAIQDAQKEFSDMFRIQLLTLTDTLQKLEMNTGQSSENSEEERAVFDQLSNLLGIPPGQLESQSCVEDSIENNNVSPAESSSSEAVTNGAASKAHKKGTKSTSKSQESSNESKRKDPEEFSEVSEEEFRSLSKLITQRCKVEDVNKVYRRLWQHFKEEKNPNKLTPKEMNAIGLKVTGATGEAKLKVLRALKLCQIGKEGSVTM